MLRRTLFLLTISALAMACGGNTTTTNTTTNAANANVNTAPKAPAGPSNSGNAANADKPANTTAEKPGESGPKRISFAKGETGSTQNITLAPGATIRFVLGATGAQTLFVTPASKELTFKMLNGIGGEFVKADDGTYSAETKGNNAAKGDILFEVRNPTAKEIKTSIRIEIEDFGD